SMRAWRQDFFVPQDVLDDVGSSADTVRFAQRGGDLFILFRNELRIPIPRLALPIGVALFVDLGNSWRDPARVVTSPKLRSDIGFGLRYFTPIGPIALDLAFNIVEDVNRAFFNRGIEAESPWGIQFS